MGGRGLAIATIVAANCVRPTTSGHQIRSLRDNDPMLGCGGYKSVSSTTPHSDDAYPAHVGRYAVHTQASGECRQARTAYCVVLGSISRTQNRN
eukprot:scaffold114477_cov28-Attheya_sp.AAC.1